MNRKGQYAIVEHIILIGAGIAIALGFLAAFQSMNSSIEGGAKEVEARSVSRMVATTAVELVESGSTGKYVLEVPATIANNEYALKLREGGVEVVTAGAAYTAPLHGIPSRVAVDGDIISRNQQIALVYTGDRLTLMEDQ